MYYVSTKGVEGVSQMLTFAYEGGGLRGHAYVIIVIKMLNNLAKIMKPNYQNIIKY